VKEVGHARYYRVSDKDWLRAEDVVQPVASAAPAEVRPGERWIDVDLKRQTLAVYIGDQPVFATLVSTGKGAPGSETETPVGRFRIWAKLRTSDMDNLENVQVKENYAIEAVPWVMFFHKGYGLHGAFWHNRFGETRSHGCVNLTPRDAERVFHWTSPRLLPGFSAVHPTAHEPGTLIRVRAD
jgi:lipoprotein-anchoring transpeptidase ErfK/SrfK